MLEQERFRSPRPTLRQYPLYKFFSGWFFFVLATLMSWIPMRLSWLLGLVLGTLTSWFYRTTTIPTNLRLCFPTLSPTQRARLRRQYFRRLGQSFINLGLAWQGSAQQLRRHVKLVGAEHVQHALDEGKGVIILAPHVPGLELGFKRISIEWPAICMYRKPRDPLAHEVSRYFRTSLGGMCLERYESMKPLIQFIRQGTLFYYLPDQDPDHPGKDYVFAPFFGVPTATFTAMSRLAKLGNAVVIPCFTYQRACGAGYELRFKPALEHYPSGDEIADATLMNKAIEDGVREMPDQYFWSYRRFKTRPNDESSPY